MKKKLFIGSSSEEIETAKTVQKLLENDFDVVIWNENLWDKSVFKLNNNFLHDLLKAPLKFDFGILIGSPDDKVEVRGKEYLQARDNILFELGLFIGRLGLKRCSF
ncbi:nucleotide-binding protein [Flavobacterium oreochromis]|nr:TIR domain-containing protein [Flavobacterium oreochromis]QYS86105.1 nucleotide-binding protein [Flavobacterium oreochromis]